MKHWDTGINNDSILCTHTHPVTGFALIDNPSIPQHAHISPPLHLHDGRGGGYQHYTKTGGPLSTLPSLPPSALAHLTRSVDGLRYMSTNVKYGTRTVSFVPRIVDGHLLDPGSRKILTKPM